MIMAQAVEKISDLKKINLEKYSTIKVKGLSNNNVSKCVQETQVGKIRKGITSSCPEFPVNLSSQARIMCHLPASTTQGKQWNTH